MFFLGIILYHVVKIFVVGVQSVIHWCKSGAYQDFSIDLINITEENTIIRYVQTTNGLNATLRELSSKLNKHAFFKYETMLTYHPEVLEDIAEDYLLSKIGLTSRHMAETGCYRIPENSPKATCEAMDAYIRLIQTNIKDCTGLLIGVKEGHWAANAYWGESKNYKWNNSPADKDWWERKEYLTSGYKCVYRTGKP